VTGALHIGHALTVAIEVLSLISAYVYMPFNTKDIDSDNDLNNTGCHDTLAEDVRL
jgi:hypothetical protein